MAMTVELTIDGKKITTSEDKTILEAARENGIYIPTLCYHSKLSPIGSCRLCVVEIEGVEHPMASCTTPVAPNIVVTTKSEKLDKIRRDALKLMLVNHPLDCPICDAGGECDLQNMVFQFGIDQVEYKANKVEREEIPFSTPLIRHWPNRCILCGRCVWACREITGNNVLEIAEKGYDSHIEAIYPEKCLSCGECLSVCPVGALTDNLSPIKARKWQAKRTLTTCNHCSVGCQLEINTFEDKLINITTKESEGTNNGSLCVKGRFGHDYIHSEERLKQALIRKREDLIPTDIDEAISFAAKKIGEIKEKYGSDAFAGVGSVHLSNEENYIFQRFVRSVIGTNNIDSLASLIFEPLSEALIPVLGMGLMTNPLNDLLLSDVAIVIGTDLDGDHQIVANKLRWAAYHNDLKPVIVDPREISLSKGFANVWMRPKPSTDTVWINGLIREIISRGLEDKDFIKKHTKGFESLKKFVEQFTPEKVEEITGIDQKDLKDAAQLFGEAKAGAIIFGSGIIGQNDSVSAIRSLGHLALITGNLGKRGGGLYPILPRCNTQGAWDMGLNPLYFPGYQPVTDDGAIKRFKKLWGLPIKNEKGLSLVDIFLKASEGKIKAMIIMGENPLVTFPDSSLVKKAIKNLEFLVVIDSFLTETAELADIVIPGVTFAEKDGTFTSCERRIQRVRAGLKPLGESMADWEIIAKISEMMGHPMNFSTPKDIFDEIAKVTSCYGNITYEQLDEKGGAWCYLGKTPRLFEDGFPGGKANFLTDDIKLPQKKENKEFPISLTVGGNFYNYLIGSKTKRAKGLALVYPDNFVLINDEDADKKGIKDGDMVVIKTENGELSLPARVNSNIIPGVAHLKISFNDIDVGKLFKADKAIVPYKIVNASIEKA